MAPNRKLIYKNIDIKSINKGNAEIINWQSRSKRQTTALRIQMMSIFANIIIEFESLR